jgi:hypothetical protein
VIKVLERRRRREDDNIKMDLSETVHEDGRCKKTGSG